MPTTPPPQYLNPADVTIQRDGSVTYDSAAVKLQEFKANPSLLPVNVDCANVGTCSGQNNFGNCANVLC
jgi:hypothetical protein